MPTQHQPTTTTYAAIAERFALRAVYVLCPLLLIEVRGQAGYVAATITAGLAQFLGSALDALRLHRVHERLYAGAGEALVRASAMVPLPLPEVEPELALGRALYSYAQLVTQTIPAIYAEGAALVCTVAFVASTRSRELILPLACAAVVAAIAYVPFRGIVQRREQHAQALLSDLHSHVMLFLSERVERVAQGADASFLHALSERAVEHHRAAVLASSLRMLLRRIPLALATLAAWALVELAHVGTTTDAAHALMALAVAQGASSLLSALTERGQLEVDGAPIIALLALPRDNIGGAKRVELATRIVAREISFSYDGRVDVLARFSFEAAPGLPLILRGENGSGKSTALKLALGLGLPTRGDVEIDGTSTRVIDLDAWHAQIAFVSQATPFDANADVREAMRAVDPALSDESLMRALDDLGLSPARDWLEKKMGALSSGQRRRVQLARAFALDRRVLVLDEPEAGLDAATQKRVKDLVVRASKDRLVVIATHSDLFDEGIRLVPLAREIPQIAAANA